MILHRHHIVPRHAGGSDDPSNIAVLTPEQHAEAHRKLWEQYGRWQDFCAWQGLAKLSKDKEHHSLVMTMRNKASWADPIIRAKRIAGMKKASSIGRRGSDNHNAKTYLVENKNGKKFKVKSLKTWCEQQGINYNSFWKAAIAEKRFFKGYTARLTQS